jgi:hypothetical protein
MRLRIYYGGQMNLQTAVFISNRACPSIAYRIKKEILNVDISKPEMQTLQHKIQNEAKITRIFSLRNTDGWLGGDFHGEDEPESCIRYLIEKGVEPNHPIIIEALNAIILRGEQFDMGSLVRVGKPLDELHIGGSKLIKACVFAYTGIEDYDFVREQIMESLDVFQYVCEINSLESIYEIYKEKKVFRDGVKWPSIYHLRLLAYTKNWRNTKNQEMLIKSFQKLIHFSPIPDVKLRYKNQIISPASIYMNNFNDNMNSLNAKEWMMWFHRTELIARLGIVGKIDTFKKQIDYVRNTVNESNGLFIKKLNHYYFTKWTGYIGLALEDDWKNERSRENDLTFRYLMILSNCNAFYSK